MRVRRSSSVLKSRPSFAVLTASRVCRHHKRSDQGDLGLEVVEGSGAVQRSSAKFAAVNWCWSGGAEDQHGIVAPDDRFV